MPEPVSTFGFAINEGGWDGNDCASAGKHWNPLNTLHGDSYEDNTHVGALPELPTNYYYEGELFVTVPKPKLSGLYSILGKAISVYEHSDDKGRGTGASLVDGNMGRPIACCNIIPA